MSSAPPHPPAYDSGGFWYAWWRGDPLPPLPALPGLALAPAADSAPARPPATPGADLSPAAAAALLARLVGLTRGETEARLRADHRPYLARLDDRPVAHGWCATRTAAIGELGLSLRLPAADRYLWGFVTEPAWRGRGIYPRLLQAIVAREGAEAERLWIGHDAANAASARGIARAGFRRVGEIVRRPDGRLALLPDAAAERTPGERTPGERAAAGAAVLGLPLHGP